MRTPSEFIRSAVRRSPTQRSGRVDRWEQRKLDKASAWRDVQERRSRSEFELAVTSEKRLHLSGVSIELCDVSQIGPKPRETLRSHGIHNGEDLHRSRHRLERLPGIGPDRADQLLSWLSQVEQDLTASALLSVTARNRHATG